MQLIPPTPQPTRGRSFQLSSFSEWFVYPHGKSVYMYNLKDPKVRYFEYYSLFISISILYLSVYVVYLSTYFL